MEIEKCAKCGVVLNEDEDNMTISFCCQCDEMYHGENMFDEEDDFQPCNVCDLPDACRDFGCAREQGFRIKGDYHGL